MGDRQSQLFLSNVKDSQVLRCDVANTNVFSPAVSGSGEQNTIVLVWKEKLTCKGTAVFILYKVIPGI